MQLEMELVVIFIMIVFHLNYIVKEQTTLLILDVTYTHPNIGEIYLDHQSFIMLL